MITKREFLDAIMKDRRLSSAQRELLRVLVDQRNKDGIVEPRASQLMEYFHLSQNAIYNRLEKVARHGYMKELGTEGRQRFFELTLPEQAQEKELELEDRIAKLEAEAREMGAKLQQLESHICGE